MKTLPNGLTVFNASPHVIRFWREDWAEPVEIEPDEVVSAKPCEEVASPIVAQEKQTRLANVTFVTTVFERTDEGENVVVRAYQNDADLVVGSIIAAQAYSGLVVAMTPAPGYERVPPAEKRMNPDKFTVF